uniref:Peptidase_M14 domain-containing protein n=1 Tax=Strongyloides stercoralis TaxID=6248 RepID=A0A0K0EL00_STRER
MKRSYPYKWNKIYNICISFLGISKECELEVKSYTDYLAKNKIQGFVTLHSYEGFILYPLGYQKKLYTDNRENLYKFGKEMRNAIENISGADYDVGQIPTPIKPHIYWIASRNLNLIIVKEVV